MAYLDVSPMIVALRTSPSDFEMKRGWLRHFPSRHEFKFDSEGNVRLHARCDCAMLAVRREQGLELWQTFQQWHVSYWRPLEINKEFASHFRKPNPLTRALRNMIAKIRRAVLLRGVQHHAAPSATDVEQAHAGFEREFDRHEFVLVLLCLFEAVVLVAEHRAGVRE